MKKKSIKLLENQIEELYEMVHMLMEHVEFEEDYYEEEPEMKMPPPPRLTSIK